MSETAYLTTIAADQEVAWALEDADLVAPKFEETAQFTAMAIGQNIPRSVAINELNVAAGTSYAGLRAKYSVVFESLTYNQRQQIAIDSLIEEEVTENEEFGKVASTNAELECADTPLGLLVPYDPDLMAAANARASSLQITRDLMIDTRERVGTSILRINLDHGLAPSIDHLNRYIWQGAIATSRICSLYTEDRSSTAERHEPSKALRQTLITMGFLGIGWIDMVGNVDGTTASVGVPCFLIGLGRVISRDLKRLRQPALDNTFGVSSNDIKQAEYLAQQYPVLETI